LLVGIFLSAHAITSFTAVLSELVIVAILIIILIIVFENIIVENIVPWPAWSWGRSGRPRIKHDGRRQGPRRGIGFLFIFAARDAKRYEHDIGINEIGSHRNYLLWLPL
jgi:hypothetical protein